MCIVLGRVACQLSWMALTEVFLRPLCFSVVTSAVCEVLGSNVKPYTDKFRPKTRSLTMESFAQHQRKDSSKLMSATQALLPESEE